MSKEITQFEKELLSDTCMLAGQLLIENGGEMFRVEDTMDRIVSNYLGYSKTLSFVMPTAIFASLSENDNVKMRRIKSRKNNLSVIEKVNNLSYQFQAQQITLEFFYHELQLLQNICLPYPVWKRVLAASIISPLMMILLGGSSSEFIQAMVIGGLGYYVTVLLGKFSTTRIIPEFLAAFTLAILAVLAVKLGMIQDADVLLAGALMPLVPGIPITNAIRDLFAGNTISGIIFGIEAILIAAAIGLGATLAFYLI